MNGIVRDLYDEKHAALIEFLKSFEFYGITTDGWSSEAKKMACISLTLHYLDALYELQKISMGVIVADYEHNAQNLSTHLHQLLTSLGIWRKVTVVVVDHAASNGAMCRFLDKDFYGCMAHFLNLACRLFFNSLKKGEMDEIFSDNDDNEFNAETGDVCNKAAESLESTEVCF